MERLGVALGERSYPIHIGAGIIDDAALYAPHAAGRRVALVSNEVVAPLYCARVEAALAGCGARVSRILVEDGERAKCWEAVENVVGAMLAARIGRDGLVVALGGGVVGDLAGFTAAVYLRGVPYLQVPTTLLAQVDSSVGGKTAINHAHGKNMIGAFHQPGAVIADVGVLATLPERELKAGIAEVLKHGFILDAGFVGWLEKNVSQLLARQPAALEHAVRRSCELKAEVVAADEREAGRRALLNFGHTFGHAIEAAAGYGAWLHGEAVAAGMVMAAELSRRAGSLGAREARRVKELIQRAGLPITGPALAPERLLEHIAVDKKAARGGARFVLLEAIGKAALRADLDEAMVRETLAACTVAAPQ